MVECPKKNLLIGRQDIASFWKSFTRSGASKFIEYRYKFTGKQRDSITISAKWLFNDKQYVLSSETWATQLNYPCLIVEQRIAMVGSYSAAMAE